MSEEQDALEPPGIETAKELARSAARGIVGAVPVAGPALSEFLGLLISAPVHRQVQDWREEVVRRLLALEEKIEGFNASTLQDRGDFAAAVMDAQSALVRSNSEEKREALANAVVNVALERSPDEDRRQMFMSYISDLTSWHLRLLALLQDPPGASKRQGVDMSNISMGAISTMIERVYPELRGQREFYDLLGRDLESRGLLSGAGFHVTMTGSGVMTKRSTTLGDEFIRFVTAPPELNHE